MRQSVLEHLGEVQNRCFWPHDSPGTGKTAISLSIASTLANQGRLAVSFFWDKNQKDSGLDSAEMFPSTLAQQLAIFSEDFKLSLVKHLQWEDLELASEQVKALIISPMCDLEELWLLSEKCFIIILDSLDECGDQETLENLMKAVLLLDGLPINFAVFVGSCPKTQIILASTAKFGPAYRNLPCEDLDNYKHNPTILRMVQEKLVDSCCGLPIIAEIWIHDFEYFCNLQDAPTDVHSEYLWSWGLSYPYIPDPDPTPGPPSSSPLESYPTSICSDIHLRTEHHSSHHPPPLTPPHSSCHLHPSIPLLPYFRLL
ncbi:uncharacterized protein EI90DRAFT_3126013 [Cantharellus anzutake]|uniref:uncharacterized protein n=1 Tax=Cantharellus anzutake TaxID=1750568 RepID=UPI001908C875|nr:uncharacterized protein EI90DRAFT_3126013 [Cantharellus anzutake]KAF8328580.1 hypothetical protein EI90DRAFT_3126013 [Cantharellus anzutake]